MLFNYHIGRIVLGSWCVLEFRCGWVGVVSVLQSSACNTDITFEANSLPNVQINLITIRHVWRITKFCIHT